MTGNARMIRNCTTNDIHVNIGMRMSVMPGARMLMIVVMKLKPAARDDTPRICRPRTQKSWFNPGEYWSVVSGVYPNPPPAGAAGRGKLVVMNRAPQRENQEVEAFR